MLPLGFPTEFRYARRKLLARLPTGERRAKEYGEGRRERPEDHPDHKRDIISLVRHHLPPVQHALHAPQSRQLERILYYWRRNYATRPEERGVAP